MRTRIYGTLGPACASAETLEQMLRLGIGGMRLNLSHVGLREAGGALDALREAASRAGTEPELLIDMQGPELRVGALPAPLLLRAGETFDLDALPLPEPVRAALAPGQELLLDDGKLLLTTVRGGKAHVTRGGMLLGRKSVALPGREIRLPALTEEDLRNIAQARETGVTALMQPFVRSRRDLEEVRAALDAAGCGHVRLLAKVESRAGLRMLPELLPACDEIVIARGDLGNAMPLWELPAAQKHIAAACREAGRAFMVVTQMLASMEQSPVPTRAEVSDIFNAVLDGAASVMITGETAAGKYPVEAARYLTETVRQAERYQEEERKDT
ncbi:MAG: pyruvate kinase [Oscillospiraceae bacterium]|nr:pyruvate kinase [Oscillospiraceae bacterium]